jgi:redox-regulated HSP33 family molecular chaperone
LAAGESPREWLATIFPDGCTVLEETPVRFFCGCSVERAESTMKLLGEEEIRAAMAEGDDLDVMVKCGFCATEYVLGHRRLLSLIDELAAEFE